jgi:hypothetical protein
MASRPAPKKRHLPTSPFAPPVEPVIEVFEVEDRVSHDTYGVGTVVNVSTGIVTVDFGSQTVRISSPFSKLEKL